MKTVKIKKDSPEATEHSCIIILLIITIISFSIAILFHCIKGESIDFWSNILLGISASSFISFVTISVPFYSKKNKLQIEAERKLAEIYIDYTDLITYLNTDSKDYYEVMSDDTGYTIEELKSYLIYLKKEEILKIINRLESDIKISKEQLDNLAFISDKIEVIRKNVYETILPSLELIKFYYDSAHFLDDIESIYTKEEYIDIICRYTKLIADDVEENYHITQMFKLIDPFISQEEKNIKTANELNKNTRALLNSLNNIVSQSKKVSACRNISIFLYKEHIRTDDNIDHENMAKETEEMEKQYKQRNQMSNDENA